MSSRKARTYVDKNGYERYVDTGRLVHRDVAYWQIYLPNRHIYLLWFRYYQVHHRDGNKRNNAVPNLQIVTQKEHDNIHGISRGISQAIGQGMSQHSIFEFMGWLILASIILGFVLLSLIVSLRAVWG